MADKEEDAKDDEGEEQKLLEAAGEEKTEAATTGDGGPGLKEAARDRAAAIFKTVR